MTGTKGPLLAITLAYHAVAAVGLALLFRETRAMAGFCIIAGVLIG